MADEQKAQSKKQKAAPPRRGSGWKKDKHDPKDWSSRALFGAPVHLPSEASIREHVTTVNDQGPSSSCVGQAITRAIHARLRKLGLPAPELSVLGVYGPARRRALAPGEQLRDDGCYPRDAMTSIATIGVPRDETWPFDLEKVDATIPLDVFQDAARFIVFRWWRVFGDGPSRSDGIAQALAKGFPLVFGMTLWSAFFDHKAGTIEVAGRDDAGGHMMAIVAYRTRHDGKREFLILNSWGTTWGEGGFCWIHEDVICGPRCSDFYAIQAQ